jgi:HEAT repeat protein
VLHDKDAVADVEKLAKLEQEYQERERIRIEQEMRAKGLVKYEGEWVTPQEKTTRELEKFEAEQRAKGLVKFEGQWMPEEEMNRIVAERDKKEVATRIADLKDPKIPREQKDQAEKRLIGIGKHAVQPLVNEVNGPDRAMRGTAALILGKIGGAEVLQPLIGALEDEDASAGAAAGLGELGDREAVDELIDALRDEDAVRAAAEALGKIGDVRAVEPLIRVLQDFYEDDATHAAAARALGMIGDSRATEPLRKVMETDKNPLVREAARLALDKLAHQERRGGSS